MFRLVFIGDSVFQGPRGYQDLLTAQLVLFDPLSGFDVFCCPAKEASFKNILEQAPLNIIGKSPDLVLLAAGYSDVTSESTLIEINDCLDAIFNLLRDKTHAAIMAVNLCTVFFKGHPFKLARCELINALLGRYQGMERYHLIDMDSHADEFLKTHRFSKGVKNALHKEGPVLTGLGALLLAQFIAGKIHQWMRHEGGPGEL